MSTAAITAPVRAKEHRRLAWGRILAWVAMGVIMLITLFPLYWILRTALSSNSSLYGGATSWLPTDWNTGSFARVFGVQAPDVFTNHLTKYAQFVDLEVLVPLDGLDATRNVNDSDYVGGLAGLWKGRDGKRYGVPKDWDTIAYFYDQKVTDAAGITREARGDGASHPGARRLRVGCRGLHLARQGGHHPESGGDHERGRRGGHHLSRIRGGVHRAEGREPPE